MCFATHLTVAGVKGWIADCNTVLASVPYLKSQSVMYFNLFFPRSIIFGSCFMFLSINPDATFDSLSTFLVKTVSPLIVVAVIERPLKMPHHPCCCLSSSEIDKGSLIKKLKGNCSRK